jgi:hypothetical protein
MFGFAAIVAPELLDAVQLSSSNQSCVNGTLRKINPLAAQVRMLAFSGGDIPRLNMLLRGTSKA